MRRLSTVLVACTILTGATRLAQAGACADHIKELRQAAQLAHKPTPESIGPGQSYGQLMFAAALAQAEAHEVLGHEGRLPDGSDPCKGNVGNLLNSVAASQGYASVLPAE